MRQRDNFRAAFLVSSAMSAPPTRRTFLVGSSAGLVLAGVSSTAMLSLQGGGSPATASVSPAEAPAPALPDSWPTQPPDLAREMVGASHGRVERVRELLAVHSSLARAAWDWGFGDWETALGAASHVGNREIAELLLAHGAQPTIFSAAMLGQVATVRAFIEAAPGIQKTAGPHGLTLLHHARAGGGGRQTGRRVSREARRSRSEADAGGARRCRPGGRAGYLPLRPGPDGAHRRRCRPHGPRLRARREVAAAAFSSGKPRVLPAGSARRSHPLRASGRPHRGLDGPRSGARPARDPSGRGGRMICAAARTAPPTTVLRKGSPK